MGKENCELECGAFGAYCKCNDESTRNELPSAPVSYNALRRNLMQATYEKDITETLGDDRNLILLGVRADADIEHLNKIISTQKKEIDKLKQSDAKD